MAGIVVRPTRSSDAGRLAVIWLDAAEYYAGLDPDAFRLPSREDVERVPADGAVVSDQLSVVAEIDGAVAGFADAHLEPPAEYAGAQFARELTETRAVVDALVVERRYWRRGAGGALLGAVEDWARSSGAALVCLDTYVNSPVSVPFYEEGMGYRRRSINLRKRL